MSNISALICVFDGEKTIKRAIRSVNDQVDTIIVVDDGSIDHTVEVVESLGNPKVNLVKSEFNRGIGAARQKALEHCESKYALWVDADDECLPNRVSTLLPYLEHGANWVYDSIELYDGLTDNYNKDLFIPDFLFEKDGMLHQLARNYIPSIGFPMINVKSALEIGYDLSFRQGEDYDHFLRALTSGGKIALSSKITYRMYELPTSLSRQLENQNKFVALGMAKHHMDELTEILAASSLNKRDQVSILLLRMLRIRDEKGLDQVLASAKPLLGTGNNSFDWLVHFANGIRRYLCRDYHTSKKSFQSASAISRSADICNNLGVVNEQMGISGDEFFKEAIVLFHGYQDAEQNLVNNDKRMTYVPLRQYDSRNSYSQA